MRFRNAHTASIDGVAPGAVGDFNPAVVKGLVDAGLLVPAERDPAAGNGDAGAMRAMFNDAWSEREAGYTRELAALREELRAVEALRAAAEARVTELEVENAQLKLDLEAATAPKA